MAKISINKKLQKTEIFATVSGSFTKFLPEVSRALDEMAELGIVVLSPRSITPIRTTNRWQHDGFILFEGDKGPPSQIEKRHLQAITRSDFIYLVNPEGYVGVSAALEIGYAFSKGIQVYAQYKPKDCILPGFVKIGMSMKDIYESIKTIKERQLHLELKESPTLNDLQDYVIKMVKSRGFSDESKTQIMLLLVEEIGELAKAIRYKENIKISNESIIDNKSIENELADCLVYILDIANTMNISLANAFRNKMDINKNRQWEIATIQES
jgi:NTP pyrophosphatase (non-canonical NTP hydrolase)